jgi:hypothetical protein
MLMRKRQALAGACALPSKMQACTTSVAAMCNIHSGTVCLEHPGAMA